MYLRRSLVSLLTIILVLGNSAGADANTLTNNWISCSDNDSVRGTPSSLQLNSECFYQEISAQSGDELDLLCDVFTESFTSAQLSYSDSSFNTLGSSSDTTATEAILRVNAGIAPQNTRYAVVTIFADQQATVDCTLSEYNPVPLAATSAISPGECIDSDNDGYGWNGVATCIPDSTGSGNSGSGNSGSGGSATGDCIDSDNDGFGWNGVATCIPDGSNTGGSNGPGAGACVDTDNDGYGWNGIATCIVSGSQPTTPSTPSTPDTSNLTDLILVTGQSNAQGADTGVSLAVLDAPNNRVFAFTDENGWQVADLRQHWDGPFEPRHPGNNALVFSANSPHNNFAFHFAKSLVALDSNRVVGFVLATSPGAGIRQWDRGSNFYNIVSNKAMTALNASNKTSFDGVLWHQGETDFLYSGTSDIAAPASERTTTGYYPSRLYTLIRNLRQEAWFSGDKAVFICGETQKTNPDATEIAPVNQRLMAINNDTDRYTGCVTADGLPTKDGIHFNASALRKLGRRYAQKYIELKDQ